MSKVIKTLIMSIIILVFSASICYAIDESELYNNTSTNSTNTAVSENVQSNTSTTDTNTTSENTTISNNTTENVEVSQNTSEESSIQSIPATSPEDDSSMSTTISGVSSLSEGSVFSTILNVALIVVGILLVLLAIAILIRLKS